MFFDRCPPRKKLEAFAAAQLDSRRVAKHIETCENCRRIVTETREEAQLLDQLRAAARSDVDERQRRKLLKICQAAAQDVNAQAAPDAQAGRSRTRPSAN